MKKIYFLCYFICLTYAIPTLADPPLNAQGYIDGESIRLDSQSGNYIITYYGDSPQGDRLITIVYDTPNKIKPEVREQMRISSGRDIIYSYEFSNAKEAKQDIYSAGFTVRVPWWEPAGAVAASIAASQASAGNMQATAQAIESNVRYIESVEANRMKQPEKWLPEVSFAKTNLAFRLSWQAHPNKLILDDIKPGQTRRGFELVLPYLPGLIKFGFQGNAKPPGFIGATGGDSKIWKDIEKLFFGNTAPAPFVASLGPKILIPEPYSTKALAVSISNDLASWVDAGQLSLPLAQRLSLAFAAMGDAAERYNSAGVRGNAERIFLEVFSRHEGMRIEHCEDAGEHKRPDHNEISFLAARAIGFNTFELTRRYFESQRRDTDRPSSR